jgi:hypothetical protein
VERIEHTHILSFLSKGTYIKMIKYLSRVFSKSIKQYYTKESTEFYLGHLNHIKDNALEFARATWLVPRNSSTRTTKTAPQVQHVH